MRQIEPHVIAIFVCLQSAIAASAGGPPAPDLRVEAIPSAANWGAVDGTGAYSFAVDLCNHGTDVADWVAGTPAHPVVIQNLYRLEDGRFEQIGMSSAHHQFCALQIDCVGCNPHNNCAGLGDGCKTSSAASIMGSAFAMGPRTDVNAFLGTFPFPQTMPSGPDTLRGRVQVAHADLEPGFHPDARYFAELAIVAADDAAAGAGDDNATSREMGVTPATLSLFPMGSPAVGSPAILRWNEIDPAAIVTTVDVPDEGRFTVVSSVRGIDDGYAYEYAVYNHNSARGVQAIAIGLNPGASVTDPGFHDVSYHSGETVDGTDWASEVGVDEVAWSTTPFDENPDANALRWGTLYNFRFVSDAPPSARRMRLSLFAAGPGPDEVEAIVVGPGACPGDVDASGTVDVIDLLAVLAVWGPCDDCPQDIGGNGVVDVDDLLEVLATWGPCPVW